MLNVAGQGHSSVSHGTHEIMRHRQMLAVFSRCLWKQAEYPCNYIIPSFPPKRRQNQPRRGTTGPTTAPAVK